MITPYNHTTYGHQLSEKLNYFLPGIGKEKQVYFTAPNSDNLFSLSQRLSEVNYPILVAIDGKDSDFSDNNSELLLKDTEYFFLILNSALTDDAEDILRVQNECEQVAFQIQAKLRTDSRNYTAGLTALDTNSFTTRSMGPIGINLYGILLGFNVDSQMMNCIDPTYWVKE